MVANLITNMLNVEQREARGSVMRAMLEEA